uniref:URI1 prefoldin like chaperone n=1 Tax=Amphilophus citrinellus TaxID=61819 RepID=A0A3Q0RNC6_AMPCI
MAEKGQVNIEHLGGVFRLREEHEKVVKDYESRIQHKKVSGDYEALDDRLKTLPDQLSYDIMVPFGPLAFMPGKLVHTNEVTVLLGDNWFTKCSAKQAQKIVDHRMKLSDNGDMNGEDTSSSSSEEEKEADATTPVNGLSLKPGWSSLPSSTAPLRQDRKEEEDFEEEEEEANCLPTIYFSHTVEPKKVRINTGKNTTLKFSERKEQKEHSKRKKKNGHNNGHAHHELHKITTPADIYLFVDVKNGEPIPRKSILKSRSRENSVCSDTSESSAADFEERRMMGRSFSHDEATHSDTSDGITEEDSPAFSGTVIEKDPMPSAVPHLTISPPALPTILERKQEEVAPDVAPPQQAPKRVSKFKAARLQQK